MYKDIETEVFVQQQKQKSDKATNTDNKYKENDVAQENLNSEINKLRKELEELRIVTDNLETLFKELVNDDETLDISVSSKSILSNNGNYLFLCKIRI